MLSVFKWIWRFLSTAKSVVGTLLFTALVVLLVVLFFRDGRPTVPDGAALVLTLDGVVVEQRVGTDPAVLLTGAGNVAPQTLLRDVLEALSRARTDDRIKAVVLDLDGFWGAGPAALREMAGAIAQVKAGGKPVIAYATYLADPHYYLAAHASEIMLNELGVVGVSGYGSYQLYFKDALDRLEVKVDVFQAGRYKSFAEPFSRSSMSPEAREADAALLGSLWQVYLADVKTQRGARGTDPMAYINGMASGVRAAGGDMARYALAARMVDRLGSRQTLVDTLVEKVGEGTDADGLQSFNQVHMDDYLAASRPLRPETGDAIAIIYAVGEIVDGEHPPGTAGGATLARLIRGAAEDSDTKAIVLRIDSPGGTPTAAEEIRQALVQAQAQGIPVVASMGTVAASGGYWIAATANQIVAAPNTITGSIGVIGLLPTIDDAIGAYGVRSDGVGTTPLADAGDITRPLSPQVRELLQASVTGSYRTFITLVGKGRKLPVETVDTIAQGRVWSGRDAQGIKLVDALGGIDTAVATAARLARLNQWRIAHVEEPASWETQLLRQLFGSHAAGRGSQVRGWFGEGGWAMQQPLRQAMAALDTLATPVPTGVVRCLQCAAFSVRAPSARELAARELAARELAARELVTGRGLPAALGVAGR